MLEHFNYDSYRSLLELLMRKNVNVCFEDFPLRDNSISYFILRHDIDFSPEAALRMAELEAKIGIHASYFILLSSPYYNLLSEEYCLFPRRLIDLGHQVGLHYDLKVYRHLGEDRLLDALRVDIEMLGKLAGKRIKSIAMHDPPINGEDAFQNIEEYIRAYDDLYTKQIAYFSDSCGAWRDEAINAFETGNVPPRLQLLIHHFFWDERPTDRWARLDEFINNKILDLRNNAQRGKEVWAKHPGVVQHDRRVGGVR